MSEDASWEDLHPGQSTDAGNTFPACTPSQNQALARLRYLSSVQVQDETTVYYAEETQESGKIPGYVLGDWAEFNEDEENSEELWEAFDQGISDGISANIQERMKAYAKA